MLHGFARLAFFAERTACTAFRLPNWESGIGNRESGSVKLSGISQAFFSKLVD
jgi:hypothetical protein